MVDILAHINMYSYILLYLFLCLVSAESLENVFLNPPSSGAVGDYSLNLGPRYTQTIQWTNNF